jgi:2-C-methyl-D-erythritol 4-phosphate cytidylyltransferase
MKKKEIFYTIADIVRTVKGEPPSRFTSAIIVAAGNSVRMGEGISKQMAMLDGMPVVVRTLRAYQQSPQIDEIIVVAREDEIARYYEFRDKYRLTKLTHVVRGGADRQESVMNGLKKVREHAGFVAIADAARPLTTPDMIERVCHNAYVFGCASAACRVVDTVKTADSNGFIKSTEDREKIWLAQTPQVFSLKIYRAAAYSAQDKKIKVTDDNSLVERIHRRVKLVDCGRENIKITTAEDMLRAQMILRAREEIAQNGDIL